MTGQVKYLAWITRDMLHAEPNARFVTEDLQCTAQQCAGPVFECDTDGNHIVAEAAGGNAK